MTEQPIAITPMEYGGLQAAYDHFNAELFGSTLPDVFLTYRRHGKALGYFSADRFSGRIAELGRHELALNPDTFINRSDEEICSTLVHEMCHVEQHNRPELAKLKKVLAQGDLVLVTKLDRLGRSTRELLELIDGFAEKGAAFKSLGDPEFDTSTGALSRLVRTMLAAFAEFERSLILERTGEGRKRAKERGVRFGRQFKLTLHQQSEALARVQAGDSLADVGRSFNVDATTIGRLVTRASNKLAAAA